MRLLSTLAIVFMADSAMGVELFRYRGAAKDGGTLQYIFESDEQDIPQTMAKEKAAEIAADFMTTFYHVQIGALETQELRTRPVPYWLVCFSDTIKGALRHIFCRDIAKRDGCRAKSREALVGAANFDLLLFVWQDIHPPTAPKYGHLRLFLG